ncbi:MAG: peptidoglycan DD-metalloendopeptidase family protein [Oscillospiraceae bacterium]|nr:peptidoglycan DD-metalloendopeptidase family protein [Oscillospiraceae bacterium]
MKRIFLILLCCVTVLASVNYYAPAMSYAAAKEEELAALKKKSDELDLQIAEAQKKINGLKGDKSKQEEIAGEYTAQIFAIQQKIDAYNKSIALQQDLADEIQAEITELDNKIADIDAEIKIYQIAIEDCEKNIAETYDILSQRLRAIYMSGESSEIEILLTADSLSTFLMRLELASGIARRDVEIVNGLKENIQMREDQIADQKKAVMEFEEAKQVHAEKKKVHTDKIAEIESFRAIEAANRADEQRKLDEVKERLDEIKNDTAMYEKLKDKYEDQQDELAARMDEIVNDRASLGDGSTAGSLRWPLSPASNTAVSSGYRTAKRPNHSGLDLIYNGGSEGKPIVAAASGKVIVASWQGGYGNCIIIDHGKGTTTLYGHCSRLDKKVGDSVERGEQIALVGNTGYSFGSHLHFEVRINGERKNPQNYVRK